MPPPAPDNDWTYKVARFAGFLGFNEMRVRWKLMKFQRNQERSEQAEANRRDWAKYEHQICPRCGALNDKGEKDCVRCRVRMPTKAERAIAKLGISPTLVLSAAIVGIYVHMLVVDKGKGLLTFFSNETLLKFGSGYNASILAGEWWRLATPMFLHGYLLHIGFNVYAFFIVGPPLERIYGRARLVSIFFVTGIAASLASTFGYAYMGMAVNSVGASGAIMGLIGVAAGWGHLQKTAFGRDLRNQMVRWGVFVVGIGFFIGADNFAHIGGFVAGGVIGLIPMGKGARGPLYWVMKGLDGITILATAAAVTIAAVPLTSYLPKHDPIEIGSEPVVEDQASGFASEFQRQREACALHRQGHDDSAIQLLGGLPRDLERLCETVDRVEAMCSDPAQRAANEEYCESIE